MHGTFIEIRKFNVYVYLLSKSLSVCDGPFELVYLRPEKPEHTTNPNIYGRYYKGF
jgi:hypothetical protein